VDEERSCGGDDDRDLKAPNLARRPLDCGGGDATSGGNRLVWLTVDKENVHNLASTSTEL